MKKLFAVLFAVVVVLFFGIGDVESCHSIAVNTGIETPLCTQSLNAAWSTLDAVSMTDNSTLQNAIFTHEQALACLQKADYVVLYQDEIAAGLMPGFADYAVIQQDLCAAQGLTPEGR